MPRIQTDWAKQTLMEACFGDDASSVLPTTWYIALLKSAVGASDNAGTVAQPSQVEYPGYAPIAYANDSAHWSVSGGAATNACVVTFASPSVSGTGALVPYFAVMTAPSVGGEVFAWGLLPIGQTVGGASVTPRFPAGTLNVTAVDPPDLST